MRNLTLLRSNLKARMNGSEFVRGVSYRFSLLYATPLIITLCSVY